MLSSVSPCSEKEVELQCLFDGETCSTSDSPSTLSRSLFYCLRCLRVCLGIFCRVLWHGIIKHEQTHTHPFNIHAHRQLIALQFILHYHCISVLLLLEGQGFCWRGCFHSLSTNVYLDQGWPVFSEPFIHTVSPSLSSIPSACTDNVQL